VTGDPGSALFSDTGSPGGPGGTGGPGSPGGLGLPGGIGQAAPGSLPTHFAGSPMGLGGGMPMMGGMGGMGGGRDNRRERKTWLTEDEKVWGTQFAGGQGLVGRPEGELVETGVEEFVLPAGPVRQPRHVEAETESGTEGWEEDSDNEPAEQQRPGPSRPE
jgi:hypothetical protein